MKQSLLPHEASSSRSKRRALVDCVAGTHRSMNMNAIPDRFPLQLAGTGAVVLSLLSAAGKAASAQSTLGWDKTFAQSARVAHQKVTFYNRLGINLVGDLYVPRNV